MSDKKQFLLLPKPTWDLQLPPISVEDFMEQNQLDIWPKPVEAGIEGLKDTFTDLYCPKEEMQARFVKGIEINTEPYDIVEEQVSNLEAKLHVYSDLLLQAKSKEEERTVSVMSCIPESFKLGGSSNIEIVKSVRSRKPNETPDANQSGGIRAKIVQYALFPGFDEWELTPLPRQVEAPHILNKVTQALTIPDSYAKSWRKYFFSQGSIAILQDMFWWVLMHQFCPNPKEQDRLYNRISDSYVSLFLSIEEQHKDFFLLNYPDALAQCLYSSFCHVYTNSIKDFDDAFKTFICDLTSEWIKGSKPQPCSWRSWSCEMLQSNKLQGVTSSDGDPPKPGGSASGPPPPKSPQEQSSATVLFLKEKPTVESHPIGPGPKFERVQFNIFGRSPLVGHYLRSRNLGQDLLRGRNVARTQITSLGPEAPTYRDVLRRAQKVYKTVDEEHKRAVELCQRDRARTRHNLKKEVDELTEIKMELLRHKNEVKSLSEKIVEYQNSDLYESGMGSDFVLEPYIQHYRKVIKAKKKEQEQKKEHVKAQQKHNGETQHEKSNEGEESHSEQSDVDNDLSYRFN